MQVRRDFLKLVPALAAIIAGIPAFGAANAESKKIILLRSSWQTVNIGDIAHTPGVLHLLEKYIPDAEIRLWPSGVENGVEELLLRRFPKLIILKSPEDIDKAIRESNFMLHGSGPSLVGRNDLKRWKETTGKPYGVYCITFPGNYAGPGAASVINPIDIELLSNASFVFFRDSVSLDFAKKNGVTCPIMEFGPDGAFAVDLRNDAAAISFLKQHNLEEGKFLCCIPHVRFTPYWELPAKNRPVDSLKLERNNLMKEHDNAPLREAIIAVTRQTNMKILICPEVETQVALGKEIWYDKLPEDVKPKVVWRDSYWLTDEAVSTYVRSAGLFALDMHSPIMCVANDIPAIVCRFFEQTSKGFMWKDIGLSDWLFDMDNEDDIKKIVPAVLALAKDPKTAKAKALKAKQFVQKRQQETMMILKSKLI